MLEALKFNTSTMHFIYLYLYQLRGMRCSLRKFTNWYFVYLCAFRQIIVIKKVYDGLYNKAYDTVI